MHALSRRSLSAFLRSSSSAARYRSSSSAVFSSPSIISDPRDDKQFTRGDHIQQFVRNHSQIASFPTYNWQVEVDKDTVEAKKDEKSEVQFKVNPVDRSSFLPSVLATGMFGWSASIERWMKAQSVGDTSSDQLKSGGMLFMISPDNPIITNLNAAIPVDTTALAAVDLQYNAASLFGGVAIDNLALMGGMILVWRHIYTGINDIMLDYVHNKNSRTLIMTLLNCYILISMKDAIMLFA